MAKYKVIGAVAVVRRKDKSERYIYRGAEFDADGADEKNIEHLVNTKLIAKVKETKADGGEVQIPEGAPKESWTVAQLEAFAKREGIDLAGVEGNKPEKFAAIEKALADKQSS